MKNYILYIIIFTIINSNLFAQKINESFKQNNFCSANKNLYSTNSYYNNLEDNYDIKYFRTDISAGVDSNYISGNVYIKSLAKVNIDTIVFEFSDTMFVDSIFVNNNIINTFIHQNFNIKIPLTTNILQNNLFTTQIYFHGSPDPNHVNRGVQTTIDGTFNWKSTWTLSESYHMNDWLPCKQDLKDKIDSADFLITTDTNLLAGSNGVLVSDTNLGNGKHRLKWKSRHPIDYYLISFAVSDYMDYSIYAHPQGYADSILVQNYIYDTPACLNTYKTDLDRIPVFIENFSDMFGLYPFADEKYGHCLVELGGGMEHQTMTTIGFFDFRVVAHELTHQWFGDNVTCATWQDIWVNEGFASYGEYLAYQCCGTQTYAKNWLVDAHNHALNAPTGSIYVPFSDIDDEGRVFNYDLSYRKGASIIHMMRYVINNDTIFFNVLKAFQSTYSDSVATGDDFKNTISQISGIDFTDFFDQWYYGEGYPVYNITWKNYNDTLFIKNVQTTTSTTTPLFTIPVEYKINFDNGQDTVIRLEQTQNTENYKIYINKKVTSIDVDPDNWLVKTVNSVLKADDNDNFKKISIYPNPSNNFIKIKNNENKLFDYTITDISGKIIKHKKNQKNKINISGLKSGIYFISVSQEDNVYNGKFIKQ